MTYFGFFKEFTNKNVNIDGRIPANYSGGINNKIKISFLKGDIDYRTASGFAILDADNKFLWYSPAQITKESYILHLDGFNYLSVGDVPARFKLYLVFENQEEFLFKRIYSSKIKKEYSQTGDKSILFYETISSSTVNEKTVDLVVNITSSGYFGFILMEKASRLNFVLTTTIEAFECTDDSYIFSAKMNKINSCKNFGLVLRSRASQEQHYDLEPLSVEDKGEYYLLSYRLNKDFSIINFPDILTLSSYYEINNLRYYVSTKIVDSNLLSQLQNCVNSESKKHNSKLLGLVVHLSQDKLQFSTILPYNGVKITSENTPKRILFSPDFLPSRAMYGEQRVYDDDTYRIKLFADVSQISNASTFAYNRKRQEKIILDVTGFNPKSGEMIVDLSAMGETMSDFTARAYKLCIAFSYKDYMYCCTLRSPDFVNDNSSENISDINERSLKEAMSFNVGDSVVILKPMYDTKGYFNIYLTDRMLSKKSDLSITLERVCFKKDYLITEADVSNITDHLTGFALSYRYKTSEDKRVYFQKGELVAKGNRTILRSKFNLSRLELTRIVWDLYVVFIKDDIPYFTPVNVTRGQIDKHLYGVRNFLYKNYYEFYTQTGTDIIFPYFTASNTLAFSVREKHTQDSKTFRFKELAALVIYKLFKPYYKKKRIILTYEKYGSYAQDNSYYFFDYCMKHNVQRRLSANIYYVIDKSSPYYQQLKKYGSNVVDFLSLRHMIYIIASRLLVSSDAAQHCYTWRQNNSCISEILKSKKLFFLQHGVTAFKRVDYIFGKGKTQNVKKIVATSKKEKDIIVKNFGYKPGDVCVTGFARWDALCDKSKGSNEILLMPTWRVWLNETEQSNFVESDYFKSYMSLLNSKRLQKFLEKNDLILKFYIHPKFKEYGNCFNFENSRIVNVNEDEPVNELLMRCKTLITDYSSVAWDVFYMGKPVLFYQFDYDRYKKTSGSYINMEKELFGDRSISAENLIDNLEKSAKNNFKLPYEYQVIKENSFAYTDNQNCGRIVQELRKMKW